MSHKKRKDLGLSSREYEDAVILERLFSLVKHNKCSTCLLRRPTYVDIDRYNLLCSGCASRCSFKAHIGKDHISMHVLEILESSYEKDRHRKIRSSSRSKRKSSTHRHGRRRSPTVASSVSSVELSRADRYIRQPSFRSVSTEDSTSRRHKGTRRKPHARRDSISTRSSVEYPRQQQYDRHVRERPPVAVQRDRYDYDIPSHKPRRQDELAQYARQPPTYHSPQPYSPEYDEDRLGKPQRKDPYGYEIPVYRDMPGMIGIMARSRPPAPVAPPRAVTNIWPRSEVSKDHEFDQSTARYGGRDTAQPVSSYPDRYGYPRDLQAPTKRNDPVPQRRENSGNPFAPSRISDRSPHQYSGLPTGNLVPSTARRFDMSEMRSALQAAEPVYPTRSSRRL